MATSVVGSAAVICGATTSAISEVVIAVTNDDPTALAELIGASVKSSTETVASDGNAGTFAAPAEILPAETVEMLSLPELSWADGVRTPTSGWRATEDRLGLRTALDGASESAAAVTDSGVVSAFIVEPAETRERGPAERAFASAPPLSADEVADALDPVEPVVSAKAVAGIDQITAPTPSATANAPTRPTPTVKFVDSGANTMDRARLTGFRLRAVLEASVDSTNFMSFPLSKCGPHP